jgi:hypothetical protein
MMLLRERGRRVYCSKEGQVEHQIQGGALYDDFELCRIAEVRRRDDSSRQEHISYDGRGISLVSWLVVPVMACRVVLNRRKCLEGCCDSHFQALVMPP